MVERRVGHMGPPGKRGDSSGSRTSMESSSSSLGRSFTGRSTLPSSSDGFGSANSLDQSMTRSLGSRGSLVDELGDDVDNINVVVRCRPLNDKERKRGDDGILSFPGEGQCWVNMDGINGQALNKPKVFTYNVVFEPEATQADIHDHSGVKRLLDMAIEGFSCTVFCYGQTGSGKTHTLTGPPHLFTNGVDLFSEDHGLIFRSFVYLFNQLQNREDQEFTLKASYLEIYNEKVIDLLNLGSTNKPLQVRWGKKKRGFFVENLFSIECAELDDLIAVLEEGLRNRAIASHNMNEYSSRSHTILTVEIVSEQKADDGVFVTRSGKINFVDLAGSEMTKKTNSEGKTLEEANNINKSLMVLGTCISALSDQRKRDGHIPYRDSKLTKLLADSLAGNGVTLMIACVSPARSNLHETLNTLRYASRAKRITSKPIIIMDPKEKVILSLQREVNILREENAHLKMLLDLGATQAPMNGDHDNYEGRNNDGPGGPHDPIGHSNLDVANKVNKQGAATIVSPRLLHSRQMSFRIEKDKLDTLDKQELLDLVQNYMNEHETIRKENKELQTVTTALVRDQELVCKENERLLRKLEDVNRFNDKDSNSVCCRSPIVPAQPTLSGELLSQSLNGEIMDGATRTEINTAFLSRSLPSSTASEVWINPITTPRKESIDLDNLDVGTSRSPKPPHHLPKSINKELEKRRIGKSMNDLSTSGSSSNGDRDSLDSKDTQVQSSRRPIKTKSQGGSRGSIPRAKVRSKSVPRQKGQQNLDSQRRDAPAPRGRVPGPVGSTRKQPGIADGKRSSWKK